MLKKLHFTLIEVAIDWSTLTGRKITDDDILRIAADTGLPFVLQAQGVKLSLDQAMQHPSLPLHYYTSQPISLKNENGELTGTFFGRVFIDADQIVRVIKYGYVMLNVGYDTDTMQVLHFAKPVKVRRGDLVVTTESKAEFERKFLQEVAK